MTKHRISTILTSWHLGWILALSLVISLSACQNNDVPDGLLTVDEIMPILKEFQLADGGISQKIMPLEERANLRDDYYDVILKKYDTDREVFYESYTFYLTQPELLDTIYTRLIEDLNRMVPVEQEKRFQRRKKDEK